MCRPYEVQDDLPAGTPPDGDDVNCDGSERIYRASSRGIGYDVTGGCLVGTCGTNAKEMINNISAFVPSRETGEAIVALFMQGARLDYRDHSPTHIQVKIGACDAHKRNLERLEQLMEATSARKDGPGINGRMIREALRA